MQVLLGNQPTFLVLAPPKVARIQAHGSAVVMQAGFFWHFDLSSHSGKLVYKLHEP
jgi:hypothetical protein